MHFLKIITLFTLIACAPKLQKGSGSKALTSVPFQTEKNLADSLAIAQELFIKGLNSLNAEEFSLAILFFEKAVELDPKSRFLNFELARLYSALQKPTEALGYAIKGIATGGQGTSDEFYLLGSLFRKQKENDSAVTYLNKAFAADPQNHQILYELNAIYEEAKDYEGMSEVNLKWTRLQNYSEPLIQRQLLLLSVTQDLKGTESFLREVWTETNNSEWGYKLSQLLRKERKLIEALSVSQQIAVSSANVIRYRALHAQNLLDNHNFSLALKELQNLVQLDPSENTYLARLGQLEFEMGLKDSAKAHLEKAVTIDSLLHLSWFYISSLYSLTDSTKAMHAIERAITALPEGYLYHNQKAILFYTRGNYPEAINILDSLESASPHRLEIKEYKATYNIYRAEISSDSIAKNSFLSKALSLLKEANNDEKNPRLSFEMGALSEQLGNYQDTEYYFDLLIKKDSSNHRAMNFLGYTLVEHDINFKKGNLLILKALQLEPSNLAYLDSKAWYYYKTKDYDNALKIMLYVEKENFKDPTVYEHLALIYTALNDLTEAHKYWSLLYKEFPKHYLYLQNKGTIPK